MFYPHGIIAALPIKLGGKNFSITMEVVDTPLEYNLLLGHNWFYVMTIVVSSMFRVLCFPHQGKIVMIDQLVFFTLDIGSNVRPNVPFVGDTQQYYMSVFVGILKDSLLMGTFPFPSPTLATKIYPINMISSFSSGFLKSIDLWLVPHPEDVESYGASMSIIMVYSFDLKIP
jgi:hypothetical protein